MSGNDTHLPVFEYTPMSGRFHENEKAFVRVRLMTMKNGEAYAQQIDKHGVDVPSSIVVCNLDSVVTVAEAREIILKGK
jgi:hypothetical protein